MDPLAASAYGVEQPVPLTGTGMPHSVSSTTAKSLLLMPQHFNDIIIIIIIKHICRAQN